MRQLQRVMSYSGARETIVDILEFVEDEKELDTSKNLSFAV